MPYVMYRPGQWKQAVPEPYFLPAISRRFSIKVCHCGAKFLRWTPYRHHYLRVHHCLPDRSILAR